MKQKKHTKQDNSFKAYKCLLYKDNFDGIIEGKLRPPIELSLDPINTCNFNCQWCNAIHVMSGKKIPTDQMVKLLKDVADWGVKGICFAGGGEPSTHPDLDKAVDTCGECGLESSIISNGYAWSDRLIDTMVRNMRWIGVSVDAGNPKTFKQAKGVDGFNRIIGNLKKTVQKRSDTNSKVGITFKYLIHPLNQYEIYDACKIAKEIGTDSFHVRPVDFLAYQDKEEQLDVKKINEQVERAKKDFAEDTFEVVPFFANFKKNLKRRIDFEKCLLTPLLGLCLPSGWWACVDRRGHKGTWLCEIDKIREFWGSKKHLELLAKIYPPRDCGKCTMAKYYPYFEAYKNDEYYWKFA